MDRKAFAEAIKKLDTKPWQINVNAPSDGAMQRGCYLENGIWKVYETDSKRRLKVLFKHKSEEKAFAWLYQLVSGQQPEPKKKWYEFWK